jgi:hypothetical protein
LFPFLGNDSVLHWAGVPISCLCLQGKMTNKQPHEDMYISKLRDSGELCILIGGCVVKRELDQNFHAFPGPIVLVYLLLKEDRQMDKTVKNN